MTPWIDPAIQAARTRAITAYLKQADMFQKYYADNPKGLHAGDARCRELLMLLYAADAGDTTTAARCSAAIAVIRKDETIPANTREMLVARFNYLRLAGNQYPSRADKMSALEQSARALVSEFPTVPLTYAALLHVAVASPDDRGSAIANDLLQMPAPAPIKAQAHILLDRLALKGTSLAQIADAAIGPVNPLRAASGKDVVLYGWSYWNRNSVKVANELSAKLPSGAVLIGLCLDSGSPDMSAKRAAAIKVPGQQIYDTAGWRGALAQHLYLTQAGAIYTAGASGAILSVNAQQDIDSALAALGGR